MNEELFLKTSHELRETRNALNDTLEMNRKLGSENCKLEKENEQLKTKVLYLEDNLRVARKDREKLKDAIADGLKEFIKENPFTSLCLLENKEFKEDLKDKATKWIRKQGWSEDNLPNDEYIQMCDAYVAGARENGAEFGYNKANEWHFVKDGDLPKENQLVLLYRENPSGANVALTYWYKSYVNDKVIAWKEIIFPKESE